MQRRILRRIVPLSVLIVSLIPLFSLPRAVAQSSPGTEPPFFAIKGARIVPVSGPVIENGTIVVAKGLIAAVGADVQIPPEAWVIDGKGLTVYPGLIDAGTDLGLGGGAPALEAAGGGRRGVTPGQPVSMGPEDRPGTTPWNIAANDLKTDDKRLETWRNAGFTTALSTPKGQMFPGQGSVIDLAGDRPGDMVVKSPATLEISLRPSGGFFSFPGSLMGSLAYIHQVFLDNAWYEQAEAIYAAHPAGLVRPAYDRTEVTVGHALANHELVLVPANNEIQIRRALRLAPGWCDHFALTGVQQGYAVADLIAQSKVSAIVSVKWPEAEKDADPDAEIPLRELRFRDRAPSTPGALAKAGVRFAFFSDGMGSPKDILKNVKKSIDAGLSPDAALRAFTLDAAEILGVADRTGSIEPGKIANLVVADGSLFDEKTKIKMVFVDGRRFEIHEPEKPKEAATVNLTGKWKLSFTTDEGPDTATADLTQAPDGSLSGSVTSRFGTSPLSNGYVTGNKFNFTISVQMGPQASDVSFSGTMEGEQLKGTISVEGQSIEFTGVKPGAVRAEGEFGGGR